MKTKTLFLAILVSGSLYCLAQEGWITDKNGGCKSYTFSNASTRTMKWDGACVNGYINGQGRCDVYEGDKLIYTYIGNTINGKFNGQGTHNSAKGDENRTMVHQ